MPAICHPIFTSASAASADVPRRLFVVAVVVILAGGCSKEPKRRRSAPRFPRPPADSRPSPAGRRSLDFVTESADPTRLGARLRKPIKFSGWALKTSRSRHRSGSSSSRCGAPRPRPLLCGDDCSWSPRTDLATGLGDGPAYATRHSRWSRADWLPRGRYAVRILMRGGTDGLICESNRMVEPCSDVLARRRRRVAVTSESAAAMGLAENRDFGGSHRARLELMRKCRASARAPRMDSAGEHFLHFAPDPGDIVCGIDGDVVPAHRTCAAMARFSVTPCASPSGKPRQA